MVKKGLDRHLPCVQTSGEFIVSSLLARERHMRSAAKPGQGQAGFFSRRGGSGACWFVLFVYQKRESGNLRLLAMTIKTPSVRHSHLTDQSHWHDVTAHASGADHFLNASLPHPILYHPQCPWSPCTAIATTSTCT